jgi:hypothetical protein
VRVMIPTPKSQGATLGARNTWMSQSLADLGATF